MDPVLSLERPRLAVDPGGEIRVRVRVHNPGVLVEQYRFSVLGAAEAWSQVVPRDISVRPGTDAEQTVDVVFRPPPAPDAPAGEVPFGIRCASLEQIKDMAVVEGDLVVSAVEDLAVEVRPFKASGHRHGRFQLDLRNTGTTPLVVAISVHDQAGLLRFAVAPGNVEVRARGTATVYLAVRARSPRLLGRPAEHPVVVVHELQGSIAPRAGETQITYQERALVPPWLLVAGALLLAALLAVLAFTLVRSRAAPGPPLTTGPPPGVALQSVVPGTSSARITWEASPYASDYEVQQVDSGVVRQTKQVKAPQVSLAWQDLAPGPACFGVVPVLGTARGPTSTPVCVQVLARPVVPTAAPSVGPGSGAPATPTPPAATPSGAATGATPTATPSGAATGGAGGRSPLPPGTGFQPQGWYVTYYRGPLDNPVLQDKARAVQAALQAQGVPARLVDSTTTSALPAGVVGFWYVLADGFPTGTAAAAECAARATVPGVTCTYDPPLANR